MILSWSDPARQAVVPLPIQAFVRRKARASDRAKARKGAGPSIGRKPGKAQDLRPGESPERRRAFDRAKSLKAGPPAAFLNEKAR